MHRRTYLGSRPSRLITGIRECKSLSPVFLLDEIDKLGSGRVSDPSHALFEILDPEQNTHFIDRYLEFSIDISKAMFICTANDVSYLHAALLDRMEVIEFRAYSKQELVSITNDFLIPKIRKEFGITDWKIDIDQLTIEYLSKLNSLRQIEKSLGRLFKKSALEIYLGNSSEEHIIFDNARKLVPIADINPKIVGF